MREDSKPTDAGPPAPYGEEDVVRQKSSTIEEEIRDKGADEENLLPPRPAKPTDAILGALAVLAILIYVLFLNSTAERTEPSVYDRPPAQYRQR